MYPEIASMFSDVPSIVWEELWGARMIEFCRPGEPDYIVRKLMAILGPVETGTLTRNCNFYHHHFPVAKCEP